MPPGQIRIIGGKWRGRLLKVPNLPNVRPTPNRVRETLFNWLTPIINGAHCLDAFTGSGALGFEALSRGAAGVVMVDESAEIVKLLQQEANLLQAKEADIYRGRIPIHLKHPNHLFDIVFLDPPFQQNILLSTCYYLEEKGLLAKRAYIYLEAKESITNEMLPTNWEIQKHKKAGEVTYHLVLRRAFV